MKGRAQSPTPLIDVRSGRFTASLYRQPYFCTAM
jgi:hypothetical protein